MILKWDFPHLMSVDGLSEITSLDSQFQVYQDADPIINNESQWLSGSGDTLLEFGAVIGDFFQSTQ